MSKHIKKSIGSRISDYTGLPVDVIGTKPIFQMYSDREMIIEGAEKLEYYDDNCAKIRTAKTVVRITGECLKIKFLANMNISVSGIIICIELEHL